jgi:hypothetical protein
MGDAPFLILPRMSSTQSNYSPGTRLVPFSDPESLPIDDSLTAILDAVSRNDALDDAAFEELLDHLIGKHSPESLSHAIAPRLVDIKGRYGELLLALVEGLARDELFDALADAVANREDLAPDLAFLALEILEGTGRIEARQALLELREELESELESGLPIAKLIEQIEDDPDSISLAVEAFSHIEPELRLAIIEELANETGSEAVKRLLEALALDHDDTTRLAAIAALGVRSTELAPLQPQPADRPSHRILASGIGPIDGLGIGEISLLVEHDRSLTISRFVCDVRRGILRADSRQEIDSDQASKLFEDEVARLGNDPTRDAHEAAASLVLGSALLLKTELPATTRKALAATFGSDFTLRPIFADLSRASEGPGSSADLSQAVHLVLDQHPGWLDRSELTRRLALEMEIREGGFPSYPEQDPGPFRVLFEGRILGRIELYRRMLLWTALSWSLSRQSEARAALRVASELADPQNAVPGHPFLQELMRRSLIEASK